MYMHSTVFAVLILPNSIYLLLLLFLSVYIVLALSFLRSTNIAPSQQMRYTFTFTEVTLSG